MRIACSECGSEMTVIKVEVDSYFDLDITTEPCQYCLDQKQADIDDLESSLKHAEQWEEECLELEQQIKELENQ